MSNAKEKAYQLINKFYFALPNNGLQEGINNVNDRWIEAKKCALIAVDEIIESIGYNCSECQDEQNDRLYFYIEVKQEIEKP